MSEVIISLTTIPSRVRHLSRLLDNIADQTVVPSRIELNIPTEYHKRNLGKLDRSLIPEGIDVYDCADYGPATKILPTLKRYAGRDIQIIYCDDDRIYHKNWIRNLVTAADCNPKSAICDECMSIRTVTSRYYLSYKDLRYKIKQLKKALLLKRYRPHPLKKNNASDIAQGFGGVLVRPQFFNDMVFSIPDALWSVDDIWLSGNMTLNDTKILWSGRCHSEKSSPMSVDGHDLGQMPDALAFSQFNGLDRSSADFFAVRYYQKNFGIWGGHSHALERLSTRRLNPLRR